MAWWGGEESARDRAVDRGFLGDHVLAPRFIKADLIEHSKHRRVELWAPRVWIWAGAFGACWLEIHIRRRACSVVTSSTG